MDLTELLDGVSNYERRHYQALAHRPRRAQQYLTSRWLLRAHIGRELDLPPTDVPLHNDVDGPPTVAGSDLHISLSHSNRICLCVTSPSGFVGCDVEWHRSGRYVNAIATHYFHPDEAAHLQHAPADRIQSDFYRLWTLKEAAQKARGLGMAGGLHSPAFALAPTFRCLDTPSAGPWTFASATLGATGNRYSLALAIAGITSPARWASHDHTWPPVIVPLDHGLDWWITTADQAADGKPG